MTSGLIMKISPDHPRQQFVFLLRNEPTPQLLDELKRCIESVAVRRSWTIQKPSYIEGDVEGMSSGAVLHGGHFAVYSALLPWGEKLPLEIDRAHYEEVQEVVNELCKLSFEHGMSFQLQLDGTVVGGIRNGSADKMLSEGLLLPWKQAVE
jgi:hypothetical protein